MVTSFGNVLFSTSSPQTWSPPALVMSHGQWLLLTSRLIDWKKTLFEGLVPLGAHITELVHAAPNAAVAIWGV